MEKFGLLQLLSSFAKNLQEENQNNNQQNILDVFMDNSVQNTSAIPPQQTNSPTLSNSIGLFVKNTSIIFYCVMKKFQEELINETNTKYLL